MPLLTEKGTGKGSALGNITIRAWIVIVVVLTVCLNSTAILVFQCWALFTDKQTTLLQIDPVLANVLFVTVGWYFHKSPGETPPSVRSSPTETNQSLIK